jgi:hypothetical protein
VATLLVRTSPYPAGATAAIAWGGSVALVAAAAAIAFATARRAWPPLAPLLAASSAVMVVAVQLVLLTPPRPEAVERMASLVRHHRAADERVGVYRAFVRNLVFYTRLRQDDLFDEARAIDFVKSPERVLLVLPAVDRPALEAASGVALRELGAVDYVNTANLRLRTVIRGGLDAEAVRVLLVTNR